MIKIGTNSISFRHLDIESFIRLIRTWNFDCIDFNLSHFTSRDPSYLRRIKLTALQSGLPLGYLGVSGGFVGDEEVVRAQIERCKDAINVAQFIGAPMIRVFAGQPPMHEENWEPFFPPLVSSLQEVSEYGANRGVFVALQNHDNRNLAAVPADVKRILREVDHLNFGFILDTGQWRGSIGAHPLGNPDPNVNIYRYIEEMVPHAVYIRTKFYRNDSGREGWLDYNRIVQVLKNFGYNGCLSIVYEGDSPPEDAIPKAAAELRTLFSK